MVTKSLNCCARKLTAENLEPTPFSRNTRPSRRDRTSPSRNFRMAFPRNTAREGVLDKLHGVVAK